MKPFEKVIDLFNFFKPKSKSISPKEYFKNKISEGEIITYAAQLNKFFYFHIEFNYDCESGTLVVNEEPVKSQTASFFIIAHNALIDTNIERVQPNADDPVYSFKIKGRNNIVSFIKKLFELHPNKDLMSNLYKLIEIKPAKTQQLVISNRLT